MLHVSSSLNFLLCMFFYIPNGSRYPYGTCLAPSGFLSGFFVGLNIYDMFLAYPRPSMLQKLVCLQAQEQELCQHRRLVCLSCSDLFSHLPASASSCFCTFRLLLYPPVTMTMFEVSRGTASTDVHTPLPRPPKRILKRESPNNPLVGGSPFWILTGSGKPMTLAYVDGLRLLSLAFMESLTIYGLVIALVPL